MTVQLVEKTLHELSTQPLLVLALARPEIGQQFPKLWDRHAQQISLRPLSKKACERLVQQVLGKQVSPETVLHIIERSAGNALYLEELIRAAADGNQQELPETVLAMLQARIGRLEPDTRRLLRAASVFGESFWLSGVLALLDKSRFGADPGSVLVALIHDEILEQRRESRIPTEPEYQFRHALVRDAAYSLLTEPDRLAAHRMAGLFLQKMGAVQRTEEAAGFQDLGTRLLDDNLFEIVRHLNIAAPLLVEPQHRIDLIHVNLQAAHRAKAAGAYQSASSYLKMGLSFLPTTPWEAMHALTFALHRELAYCEFLCARHDEARALFKTLADRSRNNHERVEVQCLHTNLCATTGSIDEAVREALAGLAICGIHIPESEADRQTLMHEELAAVGKHLGSRRIADLSEAAALTDAARDLELVMLAEMMIPSYFQNPTLFAITNLKMVNIALVYGNTKGSAISYISYACFLAAGLGRYEEALEFGRLALKLNERFPQAEANCRILIQFGAIVAHFRLPLSECIGFLERALVHGAESGERMFYPYAALFLPMLSYGMGKPLSVIAGLIEQSLATLLPIRESVTLAMLGCFKQVLRALTGQTYALNSLDDGQFSEAQHLSMLQEQHLAPAECWYHVRKAQLAFLSNDFPAAYRMAAEAERLAPSCLGTYYTTEIPFWKALALLSDLSSAREGTDEELARDLRMLTTYADNAPGNYLHKLRIVQAVQAGTDGESPSARALYLNAIELAEAAGSTSDAALAHHSYARFLMACGDEEPATAHRQESCRLYSEWGASAVPA